jgi:hypothetical protein
MFASQCLFCGHANPARAKFCNACAAPLHFKPCKQCGAINDLPATNCLKCGAEFAAQLSATEPPPASAPPEVAVASSPASDGDLERGYVPLPKLATEILEALQRRSGNGHTEGRAKEVEVVAREPRRLASRVTPFFSVEQRATQVFSLLGTGALLLLVATAIALVKAAFWVVPVRHFVAAAGPPRIARVMLPAFLVVLLAVSGYYIYRYPPGPGDGLNTGQPEPAGTSDAIRTPSPALPARIGVPATVGLGTVGMSTEATSRPAPVVAPANDVAGSQVTQGPIRTTGSESVDAETLTPAQAPAATASQSVDTVGVGPPPATPVATESRQKAVQAVGQRAVPKQMPSNRSTAKYPEPVAGILMRPRATDTRANIPTEVSRSRDCTEAVAVLGFCNPNTRGENN